MKKGLLLAATTLAGLLAGVQAANAAGSASGTFNMINPDTQVFEGTWNVTLTQDNTFANIWHVNVDTPNPTTLHLNEVWLRFYDSSATNTFGTPTGNAFSVNLGASSGGVVSPTYSDWDKQLLPTNGKGIDFTQGSSIVATNANPFHATVKLSNAPNWMDLKGFRIVANNDGTGNKFLKVTYTPEASSLIMLLPGLIPVGLVMRRRNTARQSTVA